MKTSISWILVLVMLIGMLPMNAFATEVNEATVATDADTLTVVAEHNVNTDRLYNSIVVNKGQLASSYDGSIIYSDIYGYVVNYPLKKGHVLSISDTSYVFSVRKWENGNYSTILKQATTAKFTATEDMTVAMLIRKPDKSAVTAEELTSIVIYDSQFGMIGVEGSVKRFNVEAKTIDGGTATTRAAIFLPESYSDSGKPTRLIVMTNGHSAHLTDSVWNTNSAENVQVIRNYLGADYAVWVVDNTAASTSQTPDLGCPQLVDSYFKAYEYVQNNLNVEEKFSVHARSFGTFAAVRIMREHPELVKCAVMTGSRVSIKAEWPGIKKAHVAKRFGFTNTTGAAYEANKLVGYDPYIDVNDADYALPPTFWMLANGDSTAKPCEFIEKLTAHGNDVTLKIYSDISHTGICTLNTSETFADALAYLEKHQVEVHAHTYSAVAAAPTCTEQGYTTYTCACGESYVADFVDALNHDYLAEVTYPAGVIKGCTDYTCSRCSDAYRTPWLDETAYEGMTIACVGDSITAAHGVTKDETDYVKLLAEQLGMDYIRLGASGTTLCTDGSRTRNISRLTEGYLKGADVVTIAMGINDFCAAAEGYYELGDIDSTDSSTIYGAVRMWCERIVELRKTDSLSHTQFYFVTPVICSWNNSVTSKRDWDQSKTNIHGYTLRDLCNAIMEVAALYDVAVIDLNLLSGMYYVDAQDNNTAVFGGDGVHPGEKGHEMMAGALAKALLQNNLRDDHGHIFGSWITTTWPSCFAGKQQRVCTVCSATESRTLEPNSNHIYSAVVTAPTCTEQGYTTYTCACGDSYVADFVDASGHNYENGICSGCSSTTSPYLQQLPENFTGCSNLYDMLTPLKGYYTATQYDISNGAVLSVVIPVEPGDRIAASSFGPVSENMGSVDGIRVTYLLDGIIVKSLSASSVYTTYTQEGYLTVPEGVNMVSVPWWAPSDSNWLTLGQISKNYAAHSPKAVPAQAPTCTEKGYTAGEVCEVCDASLGSREEIPATGHDYNGNTCTVCGAVNILAILDGKYVSVLGDSISTFNGYSNDAAVNSTIGGNGHRYDAGTADTKPGSYCLLESVDDTWWMHFANRSGMKLLVNNSWAGSQVFGGQTSDGRLIPPAYLERCINLHDNTIENNPGNAPINPDVIFVYLGINDYNFNRNNVGNGAVDYAKLVSGDGAYVTPTTFGEAYGILLHKMQKAYPDAQIFAMTLLPENLYSVNMTAWEQHNAYIRAAAEYYDVPLVDLAEKCAITWENYSGYMIDKIHPTTAGMELISDCIEKELLAHYKENPPHVHTPVIDAAVDAACAETGLTEGSHCETCGEILVIQEVVPATGHTYENGICTACGAEHPNLANYEGKVISILGDSISTFVGYVPEADGFNLTHKTTYPFCGITEVEETWWMQVITALSAQLGINESWSGTEVYNYIDAEVNGSSDGTKACMASITRIQNLGSNGTPDVILFYGGTNDIGVGRPIGTFDPAAAPSAVDLTSVKWTTVADAYVAAIMRMQYYYPDAQIIAMLPTYTYGYYRDTSLEKYNALFASICSHYGVTYIDLRECGISETDLPDGIHPNATGMDYISEAVLETLLQNCSVEPGAHVVYSVCHSLENASATLAHYKGISANSSFVETISGEDISVTVSMGGEDITQLVYADGVITIPCVTGDLVITATAAFDADGHLQQLPENLCSGTNLWTTLTPEKDYYSGTAWVGKYYSVTFPICAGERLWANSIGKAGTNGHTSTNGIHITFWGADGVIKSMPPAETYAEYVTNGWITVPEGAVAVNIGQWTNSVVGEIYLLDREHTYENGICTACGAEHPNLANYEGKVISILGDSISTFAGYIPVADGFNLDHRTRYPQDNLLTDVNETWWMQILKNLDAKLGINDSWASTEVYNYIDAEVNSTSDGTKACMASVTRIQNLGSNGTPDVILFFGGTNDITQSRPLGTFDPAAAPTEVDLTSVKWDTVADAYVDAIMRMQYYYPDAQIVAMLPYYRNSQGTAKVDKYNNLFASICEHYGVAYVDLRYCGISNANIPDGTHPDADGMDYITDAVMELLASDCNVTAGEHIVHSVTHNLNGAKSTLGYYKGISHGKSFTTTITGDDFTVTVTMAGVDITADCYANGVISIGCVTGDLVITAEGRPKTVYADYLQKLPTDLCCRTNLWAALKPINLYYRSSGWGLNATGLAHSITFPVSAGDQIWATSFQESGLNGSTKNGIALTWFDTEGAIETFTPEKTYAEFAKNGYLTAPEGAVAVNVVMWNGDKSNEVYILNRDHSYENGSCTGCGTHLPGDINGDGEVNSKDVTRLFRYLSGYDVEVVEAALDVNGDGEVNNKDLTRLFRYLSGYDVEIQ